MLPPLYYLQREATAQSYTYLSGMVVCVQEKGWMDKTLMIRYIREIWAPHTHKTHSLLVLDSYKVHAADSMEKEFKAKNTTFAIIPGVCTSKIQPPDVSINCPFKDSLRTSWCKYMQSRVHRLHAFGEDTKTVKTASSRLHGESYRRGRNAL